jgi:hypothetical protein
MVYALDTELDNSWGVKRIGAGLVHDSGNNGGAGVKVAIIDTGIDYNHSDLYANYAGGYDFVNSDDDPMDDNGHGTHVAGIIAALDNEIGVVGVAPEAELYALKALDKTGSGYVSDVIYAIQWASDPDGDGSAKDRLDIINMSLGADVGNIFFKWACNLAYRDGLLLVAAAGNGGSVIYPAAYSSVIAVSATSQDNDNTIASFSSTGSEVELAAPGVNIYSTYLNNNYKTFDGTSMSSPHVAGTAALVWADKPGWSNKKIRAQLQDTADDLGASGRDSLYGYGLVNAAESAGVQLPPPNKPPTVSITSPMDGSIFNSGETILFEGTASDPEDGDLTGDLVWISSINGQIGTGGSFSTTILNDGTHTITANVTDSGSETGSASIGITVGTLITDNMHVSDIEMSLKSRGPWVNAIAKVTIVDESGTPVESATVSGQWSGVTKDKDSGVTNTNGEVSLKSDKARNPAGGATFTFTVGDVAKAGWTYDSNANVETSDSITVP